jgi:limonene-1,2-epoxide hydrolase
VGVRLVAGLLVAVAAVVLVAGCGGDGDEVATPEQVVRTWSAALNAGDDEAAADLFAANATVSQPGYIAQLPTREDAVAFNRSLPCSGQIVELTTVDNQVTATFLLGDRPASPCDGPGQLATAVFVVEDGKIVVWQQVPTPVDEPDGGGVEA